MKTPSHQVNSDNCARGKNGLGLMQSIVKKKNILTCPNCDTFPIHIKYPIIMQKKQQVFVVRQA